MREAARPRVVVCPHCKATDRDGDARTLFAAGGVLSVTWHVRGCPHLAADQILAEAPGR
ncbi:hypothetical protein [Streptomyces sp. NBC_01264]|uniref:hypothetical protein n=1 Tax=Streptomyces sp. NBC_01264 TaxID=2903804 RepID=UPI00224CABE6|nr:hypothetical protein [Streptomyces sp. NBC_01264]MCX4775390.1 hypothetical protein [Streptomyces sp. NBC_01264]